MMSRVAVVDTVLPLGGGEDGKSPVFVKAGTRVYNYVYSLHRAKDRWGSNAEEFRPERWDGLKGHE
jgi:cytochrome P450